MDLGSERELTHRMPCPHVWLLTHLSRHAGTLPVCIRAVTDWHTVSAIHSAELR